MSSGLDLLLRLDQVLGRHPPNGPIWVTHVVPDSLPQRPWRSNFHHLRAVWPGLYLILQIGRVAYEDALTIRVSYNHMWLRSPAAGAVVVVVVVVVVVGGGAGVEVGRSAGRVGVASIIIGAKVAGGGVSSLQASATGKSKINNRNARFITNRPPLISGCSCYAPLLRLFKVSECYYHRMGKILLCKEES